MKGDAVKTGTQQAPHRSPFNVFGMTEEEMKKPMVGIVSSYNEIVLSHMNLGKIAEAVELGVVMVGGTPVVLPAVAICDGIAMGHVGMKYPPVTRGLIAGSTKCMALVHQFGVLVMVPNCDENVPGLLMATAKINISTVFVSDGPMLARHVKGHKTSLSSVFEAVGSYTAGTMSEGDVKEYENRACPTYGSYSGVYTASNMNCLIEVLGMGLKGNGTILAAYSEHIKLARHADMQVMEMYRQNIRPRDIMTKDAFMNALIMGMALGCSTNSVLYLPAVTHEADVELNVDIANEISARTPNLCRLVPAGPTYIEDLNEAGGVYVVMDEVSKKGLLNLNCMTVTGRAVGESIKDCGNRSPSVIRPVEHPYSETGGIAILKGSLASNSVVVKRSAVAPEMLRHEGPVRVSDCGEDAIDTIKGSRIVAGDVVVTRYEGSEGGPDMREMLNPTSAIAGMGLGSGVAPIADGRFSGASKSVSIGHATPETAMDGPVAFVEEGDIIFIDIGSHQPNVLVDSEEMAARRAKWQPRTPQATTGHLTRYASLVTSANKGAVLQVKQRPVYIKREGM